MYFIEVGLTNKRLASSAGDGILDSFEANHAIISAFVRALRTH